jgi:isoamylase
LRHRDRRGQLIMDESFLLLMHAGDQGHRFTVPGAPWADQYVPVIDTNRRAGIPATGRPITGGTSLRIAARSVLLLRAERGDPAWKLSENSH